MVNYANFSQQNTSTYTGDYVIYQGKPALIKMGTPWSNTLMIEVDGKTITVNKNDLFGINNKKDSQEAWFERQITEEKETIAENDEKIKNLNEVWNQSVAMIRNLKETMYNLLRTNNVSHYSDLDAKTQEEYLAHMTNLSGARDAQLSSSNSVIRLAHQSGNAAFRMQDLNNQQALCDALRS